MNAAAVQKNQKQKNEFYAPNMTLPVVVSVIFHIAVFALATLGIPYLANPPEQEEMFIAVELFTPDEISQTTEIDEPDKIEEEIPPPPDIKPVYNNEESAPDLLSPTPPEIEEIVEPIVPDPEPIVEPLVEETVEPDPEPVVPDPHLIKTPPKPKAKPKPPEKPKVEEKKPEKEQVKVDDSRNINSLLKDLTPVDDKPVNKNAQVAQLAEVLTTSEFAAMGKGVAPCWNVDAGMTYSDDLYVVLHVIVGQDRRVLSAEVLPENMGRYRDNYRYRAAADAARRALLNENCRTLNLPADKYQQWKEFYYPFDPRGMLR